MKINPEPFAVSVFDPPENIRGRIARDKPSSEQLSDTLLRYQKGPGRCWEVVDVLLAHGARLSCEGALHWVQREPHLLLRVVQNHMDKWPDATQWTARRGLMDLLSEFWALVLQVPQQRPYGTRDRQARDGAVYGLMEELSKAGWGITGSAVYKTLQDDAFSARLQNLEKPVHEPAFLYAVDQLERLAFDDFLNTFAHALWRHPYTSTSSISTDWTPLDFLMARNPESAVRVVERYMDLQGSDLAQKNTRSAPVDTEQHLAFDPRPFHMADPQHIFDALMRIKKDHPSCYPVALMALQEHREGFAGHTAMTALLDEMALGKAMAGAVDSALAHKPKKI